MKKHGIILFIAILLVGMVTIAMAAGGKAITPSTHGNWDLGTSALLYKDIRILGDVYSNGTKVIESGAVVGTTLATTTTTVTLTPANVGADVTVPTGSILLGLDKISGFNNAVTITRSLILGTTLIINTDAHTGSLVINATYF